MIFINRIFDRNVNISSLAILTYKLINQWLSSSVRLFYLSDIPPLSSPSLKTSKARWKNLLPYLHFSLHEYKYVRASTEVKTAVFFSVNHGIIPRRLIMTDFVDF